MPATIESLVSDFTAKLRTLVRVQVLAELRGMTLDALKTAEEGAPPVRGRGGPQTAASVASAPKRKQVGRIALRRLPRRSATEIEAVLNQIMTVLRQNPKGLPAKQIAAALGIDRKEVPRPLAEGLARGDITKSGEKRDRTYVPKVSKKTSR